jgi:hypothetical protein
MSTPYNSLAFAFKQIHTSRKNILSVGHTNLKKRDQDFVFQGLFLFAIRKFESFLEEQLTQLSSGSLSWSARRVGGVKHEAVPILKPTKEKVISALMSGGNEYPKLLPYSNCVQLAELFLSSGKPFSLLDDAEKGRLTRCQSIRNLIAHNSQSAKRKFEKVVLSQHKLPPYRRNPAGFLQAKFSVNQTYFDSELAGLITIARKLS